MAGPYIEASADVFDPVANQGDWREVIDSGASHSTAGFSNDEQTATIVGYIPWNKQRSAIQYFLGFSYADSSYTLHRQNPQAHPLFPWLYASEISLTPFNPTPNENATTQVSGFPLIAESLFEPFVTLQVANHLLALCTVKFRSYRYTFLDDSDITEPQMEWMRNVFLDLEPSVEALSADGIGQLTWAETGTGGGPENGPTVGDNFPAPVAELLGKNIYTLNWVDVPYNYLSTDDDIFYPANILACLGKVNSTDFPTDAEFPFLPGTMLMRGVKFVQKVYPVAPLTFGQPLISVDVSMDLQYFNPSKGNTDLMASPYFGHNLFPWRGGPFDGTGGLFFYATRGNGGPPFLQNADFNNMFVSPNA